MKHWKLFAGTIILSLILITIGLSFGAQTSFDIKDGNIILPTDRAYEQIKLDESFNSMQLNLKNQQVEVSYGDSYAIELSYTDQKPKFAVSEGVLYVNDPDFAENSENSDNTKSVKDEDKGLRITASIFNMSFGFGDSEEDYVKVQVPYGTAPLDSIIISNKNGVIECDVSSINAQISNNNGVIDISDSTFTNLTASNINGAIKAEDVKADVMNLTNENGAIKTDDVFAAKKLDVINQNGGIMLIGAFIGESKVTNNNGYIDVTNQDFNNNAISESQIYKYFKIKNGGLRVYDESYPDKVYENGDPNATSKMFIENTNGAIKYNVEVE
ncbi:MAG: DUF4097 domain-containing protein [Clostridiales bacterium]|jgi:DUF4097 and DUF4098 domain-containing protein YvlB|nr:DUF4097 domain-containing protein [Clostridiales bacterium]